MNTDDLSDAELQKLYSWIDEIPLSRPKRNISRDFADCVLVAEVVSHYFPKIVQLHNYSAANSSPQKLYNWNTLNTKVLRKLGWQISKEDINGIVMSKQGCIERFLHQLQFKMAKFRANGGVVVSAQPKVEAQFNKMQVASKYGGQQQQVPPQQQQQQYAPPPPPQGQQQQQQGNPAYDSDVLQREVDEEILLEKEQTIQELRETLEILTLKISKLEQLVRLKDGKINKLQSAISNPSST